MRTPAAWARTPLPHTTAFTVQAMASAVLMWCMLGAVSVVEAQAPFPPVQDSEIRRIEAVHTSMPIQVDGRLDEPAWQDVKASPKFVDLISGKPTAFSTTVKVLWNKDYLYVGYQIEEPNVAAAFTERDSLIYQENDVELFIAGEDAYYEFEVNALGTIYEGLFAWQSTFESSGLSKLPELDRKQPDVKWQRFNGVGLKNHPRGLRWAFLGWDFPDAKVAASVQGTLNDPSDKDEGWTVELAFPWREMKLLNLSKPRNLPPKPGDVWRIDFSRFNKNKVSPAAIEGASEGDSPQPSTPDSGGWALSYHGVWDSHIPECFPYVTFVVEPNQE